MVSILKLIGSGPRYPFSSNTSGGVSTSDSIQRINQSLFILFNTRKGSRLGLPDFGSDITRYRFEPLDHILISQLRESIIGDIRKWEPRISVERIKFYEDPEMVDQNILYINIDYIINNTDVRGSFVYPYIRELYTLN